MRRPWGCDDGGKTDAGMQHRNRNFASGFTGRSDQTESVGCVQRRDRQSIQERIARVIDTMHRAGRAHGRRGANTVGCAAIAAACAVLLRLQALVFDARLSPMPFVGGPLVHEVHRMRAVIGRQRRLTRVAMGTGRAHRCRNGLKPDAPGEHNRDQMKDEATHGTIRCPDRQKFNERMSVAHNPVPTEIRRSDRPMRLPTYVAPQALPLTQVGRPPS